jgi:sodium/potassium-transporting ATPase subunit alpha
MAAVFIAIGIARGEGVFKSLILGGVTVLVANIPQGLPTAVTTILGLAAKKLADQKIFVKSLMATETLGSITVIASDKTGTLTMNKMSVCNLWFDLKQRSSEEVK